VLYITPPTRKKFVYFSYSGTARCIMPVPKECYTYYTYISSVSFKLKAKT